jgi:hypothetical protein
MNAPLAGKAAFKVNSLTDLDQAKPDDGEVFWDGPRSIWNMGFLFGGLTLGPIFFTWSAFAVFLILSAVTLCAGLAGARWAGLEYKTSRQSATAPRHCAKSDDL